jgi:hypothetical protein
VTRASGFTCTERPMLERFPALPDHAGLSGQSPAPDIAHSQFRYGSERQSGWTGPPPRAATGSFPENQLIIRSEVMQFTGASGLADKETIR